MQRTFTVKREAERHAARVETAKETGETTTPLTARTKKLREVVEASLAASRPKLKEGTYLQYEHLYRTRILPTFGDKRIAAITSEDVEVWIAELVEMDLAPNTIHNHYVLLNKVFRYALRHRILAHNPCVGVELPRNAPKTEFAPVFLTPAQVTAVCAQLRDEKPLPTLIRFAACTGLRAAEIAGLRVRDVAFDAGHIEVRQTMKRIGNVWTVGTPKSKRSTRTVPLLDRQLIGELKAVLLTNPNSGDPEALFWPGRANGSRRLDWSRPVDVGGVLRYYLRPALTRAKLPRMRFHDLRHTYASLMFAAGFKPYEVSRYMGHAGIATTDGIYAHLYPSDYQEQIARFEAYVADA